MMKTSRLLLFLVFFCTTAISNSTEVFNTHVWKSGSNIKTIRVNLRLPYSIPPLVKAWTLGASKYPDSFITSVSNVDTKGFDATIRRSDGSRGWGQNPTLYWTETPSGERNPSGEIVFNTHVWNSNSNTKKIFVYLRLPHSSIPRVKAWTQGESRYPDSFSTSVSNLNTNGFLATITRTDESVGWGQNPTLYWTETAATDHQPQDIVFNSHVWRSNSNSKRVYVKYRLPHSSVPTVIAWTQGASKYSDSFSTTVSDVDINGFVATIKRTDESGGWGQNPTLYWTET